MSLEDIQNEYRQAVSREQFVRGAAFLPITDSIGAFEVVPMTLGHFLNLSLIGSPFICARPIEEDDAANLLWLLSPHYSKSKFKKALWLWWHCRNFSVPSPPLLHTRKALDKWACKLEKNYNRFLILSGQISKYVEETMQDSPGGPSDSPVKAYVSDVAGMCHVFRCAYSWPRDEVLKTPLKILFQFLKLIQRDQYLSSGKPPILFNPSDKILNRVVDELNQN